MTKVSLRNHFQKGGCGAGGRAVRFVAGACDKQATDSAGPRRFFAPRLSRPQTRQGSITQTGEVQARFRAELAFG